MVYDLQVDQQIDGVPPGMQATKFGSHEMLANVDLYMHQNADKLGLETVHDKIMSSFVKGLGLEHEPKALALTVSTAGIEQFKDDGLGQHDVSAQAGLLAQQAQQDLGKGSSV